MLRFVLVATLTASASLAAPGHQKRQMTVVEHEMETTSEAEQLVWDYWTAERVASIDHDPFGSEPYPVIPEEEKPRGAPFEVEGLVPKTIGRLLYTEPYTDEDGDAGWRDSSCTATILESANEATIVTAAHCLKPNPSVRNETAWHRNVLFLPGFRDNEPQAGSNFTLNRSFMASSWANGLEKPEYMYHVDRAFAVLNVNSPAGKLTRRDLGPGQKIQFENNATTFPVVHNLGYPRYVADPGNELRSGAPAFTGRRLAACFGKAVDWWRFPSNMAGFPCLMGGGSSGGPHMADFDFERGVGSVVAVNSLLDVDGPIGEGEPERELMEYGTSVTDEFAKLLYDTAQAVEL